MIDATEHLGLVSHVVRRMNIPPYLHDEAHSEGLVILALAAAHFDPAREVPVGAYLAQRLRWGLQNWQRRELRQAAAGELPEDDVPLSHEAEIEARRLLDQVIYLAARRLNAPEYVALLGLVYGARQSELSAILQKNPAQLEALRLSARAKLRHELRLL